LGAGAGLKNHPMPEPIVLELLRCPRTRQRLQLAPNPLIAVLEKERVANRLLDDAGNPVLESFESGLIRVDGLAFYPVRQGIPVMTECIPVQA